MEGMMNIIKVPQLAWYEPKEFALSLPDEWQVEVKNMTGYNRPPLNPDEIKAAINAPIGIPPIRDFAKGKKDVVILIDDMARVTRAGEIVPSILEELAAAGIPDRSIRFVMALGCHGARDRRDFAKKLGEEVLARFPVYNHNPFGNCTYVGTTATFGTKVYVNEEVMKCDLKIAISSVVPHPLNGFGGGGKIILPGITSFETTKYNHMMIRTTREKNQSIAGMGIFDNDPAHLDSEEAATLAGLDVVINCIVNMWGETVAIFAGALKPAYAAAIQEAKTNNLTPRVEGKDIVIANTFAKVNEAWIGLPIAYSAVKPKGDVVLIANSPEGQVTHYLIGPFGRTSWGPQVRKPPVPKHINRLIVYTEYPDLASRAYFGELRNVLYLCKWDDVLQALQEFHGKGSTVAVYPAAEIQYCVQQ